MTVMYALKCDLCGKVQVEESPTNLRCRAYMENSVQKHACPKCDGMMKAAIELGAKGLNKPLEKVSKLIRERDQARRARDEASAALSGMNPTIGSAHGTLTPRGIKNAAEIARGIAASRAPTQELPAPKDGPRTKRLGKKK